MAADYPEISSFGTLLKFALALEEAAEALHTRAAATEACADHRGPLEGMARKHARRRMDLERLARERLNEVLLQPLSGMSRGDYLPPGQLPVGDASAALDVLAAMEESSARFFEDSATRARDLLGGLDRTFRRFAKEDARRAAKLKGMAASR